jgi:hypothetical protein
MKLFLVVILTFSFLLVGCAHDKIIDGKTYHPYGVFNLDDKCDSIQYKPVIGNIVWSCLLVETIFTPVICAGWYLWEPVEKK